MMIIKTATRPRRNQWESGNLKIMRSRGDSKPLRNRDAPERRVAVAWQFKYRIATATHPTDVSRSRGGSKSSKTIQKHKKKRGLGGDRYTVKLWGKIGKKVGGVRVRN